MQTSSVIHWHSTECTHKYVDMPKYSAHWKFIWYKHTHTHTHTHTHNTQHTHTHRLTGVNVDISQCPQWRATFQPGGFRSILVFDGQQRQDDCDPMGPPWSLSSRSAQYRVGPLLVNCSSFGLGIISCFWYFTNQKRGLDNLYQLVCILAESVHDWHKMNAVFTQRRHWGAAWWVKLNGAVWPSRTFIAPTRTQFTVGTINVWLVTLTAPLTHGRALLQPRWPVKWHSVH